MCSSTSVSHRRARRSPELSPSASVSHRLPPFAHRRLSAIRRRSRQAGSRFCSLTLRAGPSTPAPSFAPPTMGDPLRIGFVPEHFSTPLHYATQRFGLAAALIPFPSGTGHMITALRAREIDIGIGLTEGWIAGLGPKPASAGSPSSDGYSLVGTYVETPLCWAISTGAGRADIADVSSLRGKRIGVSRIGSGSYVMGFVLADQHGWLATSNGAPFDVVPLQTFAQLRAGVNDHAADFFMWEHFTSKRYFASSSDSSAAAAAAADGTLAPPTAPIKRIGEIYTPWPSWHIVARDPRDSRLDPMFDAINKGVAHFEAHPEENVQYISTSLDYTEEDAREWLETVRFASDTKGVRKSVVDSTIVTLRKAGVLTGDAEVSADMIGIKRAE